MLEANYSRFEAIFEWTNLATWHVGFIIISIRISCELTSEFIVLTRNVMHMSLTLMGCAYR